MFTFTMLIAFALLATFGADGIRPFLATFTSEGR